MITRISIYVLLTATAAFLPVVESQITYPQECLATASSVGVCIGLAIANSGQCTNCAGKIHGGPDGDFCALAEYLQCNLQGCCNFCPGNDLIQCVLDNAGVDCGEITCGGEPGTSEPPTDAPETSEPPTDALPTDAPTSASTSSQEDDCGFCPGGYSPQNPDAIYGDFEDLFNLTCGQVDTGLSEVPLLCVEAQRLVITSPGYPAQCGYCVTPADTTRCTMCPDGSIPMADPDTVASDGDTCGRLAYIALYQEPTDGACADIQKLGVDECGCGGGVPGTSEPPTDPETSAPTDSSTDSPTDAPTDTPTDTPTSQAAWQKDYFAVIQFSLVLGSFLFL